MWKILHKLFGWDYVLLNSKSVRRVCVLKSCDKYTIHCGRWVFLNEDGSTSSNIWPTYRPLTWDLEDGSGLPSRDRESVGAGLPTQMSMVGSGDAEY